MRAAFRRFRQFRLPASLAFSLVLWALSLASFSQSSEYQLKASWIYRFAKYSTWPKEKLKNDAPIVIGIYGPDQISDSLRAHIAGRKLAGREVVIKRCKTTEEITSCHILFVGGADVDRLGGVLGKAASANVVTVGESENFVKKGGVFSLFNAENTVKFSYDRRNLQRCRVDVDPELLLLSEQPSRR